MSSIVNASKVDTIQDKEINSISIFVERNTSPVKIQPDKEIWVVKVEVGHQKAQQDSGLQENRQ